MAVEGLLPLVNAIGPIASYHLVKSANSPALFEVVK